MLLNALSKLITLMDGQEGGERVVCTDYDLKKSMSFLKDAFSFGCKPNQSLNQLRRTLIRPSGQTRQFSNLADIKNEIFEYLFGDSISYRNTEQKK